jgi:hypothetical protein
VEPGLLGQKGFSRSHGFFQACGGIFQDRFDLTTRNAIANILDRYSLAQVSEFSLKKLRWDGLPIPFAAPMQRAGSDADYQI